MDFIVAFLFILWITDGEIFAAFIGAVLISAIFGDDSDTDTKPITEPVPIVETVEPKQPMYEYGYGAEQQYCRTMMEQHFKDTTEEQRAQDLKVLGATVIAQTRMGGDPVYCMSDGSVK